MDKFMEELQNKNDLYIDALRYEILKKDETSFDRNISQFRLSYNKELKMVMKLNKELKQELSHNIKNNFVQFIESSKKSYKENQERWVYLTSVFEELNNAEF